MRRTLQTCSVVLKTTGGGKEAMKALKLPTKYKTMQSTKKTLDKGILLLNIGMTASLIGMSCSDMLQLRSLSLFGGICGMMFNFTRTPRMIVPMLWGGAFGLLNTYHIISIVRERMPTDFTNEERQVHDLFFQKVSMRPRAFQKIHALATHKQLSKGDTLATEGERNNSIHFLINGSVDIEIAAEHKGIIAGGSAGAIIGEISFLEYIQRQQTLKKKKKKCNKVSLNELQKTDDVIMLEIFNVENETANQEKRDPGVQDEKEQENNGSNQIQEQIETNQEICMPRSSATVIARENTHVATFATSDLQKLFDNRPDLLASWNSVLSDSVVSKLFQTNEINASKQRLAWFKDVVHVVVSGKKEDEYIRFEQRRLVRGVKDRLSITNEEKLIVLKSLGWEEEDWQRGRRITDDSFSFLRFFGFEQEE
tara:strand:+ start:35 stop:1306 length:1272 start_codon:yes stop_codon:yes gene_type:complete